MTRSSPDAYVRRRRFTAHDACIDDRGDVAAHLVDLAGRVDDGHAIAVGGCDGHESIADAAMETEVVLGLEPRHVARSLPGESRLDRHVEQHREIGSESLGRCVVEPAKDVDIDTGSIALVGVNRAQITVVPAASSGRITSRTSWRRAALNSSASASGSVGAVEPVRSSSSSRIRSPSQVPPGSRVT